jgi:hypothetical protein
VTRESEVKWLRSEIAHLRVRLRELEPPPTSEQVKEALRAQDAGSTLKEYARSHRLNYQALCLATAERRRWEWRVKEYGPGPHRAGPEP